MAGEMFHEKYFQGILQLRDCSEDVLLFAVNETEKENRPDIYISRKVNVRGGIDLYLTSNKFLRTLGKRLKKEFGGELMESEKLFTRNHQTSKDVYRLNILFRPCPFKKGEIVEVKGSKYKIMFIGSKIQAKEVKTGKKTMLEFKDVKVVKQ